MVLKNNLFKRFSGDFMGGTAALLVALPSTIAYGIMSFTPLGTKYSKEAAVGAVIGTIIFSLLTPLLGGTKRLISSPSAPVAAVLSLFVYELKTDNIAPEMIPVCVTYLTFFAGLMQFFIGNLGGGKFIKYIPYPVITGYLTGVAFLILIGQVNKVFGIPKEISWSNALIMVSKWDWRSMLITAVTVASALLSKKYIKKIPYVVISLFCGIATYFIIALFQPALLDINNPMIIGELPASPQDITQNILNRWLLFPFFDFNLIKSIAVPAITLSVLLSVTTLNTCVVLDTRTFSSHNPKKELIAQGMGNIASSLVCGIPEAGLMGATIENVNNGGKSKYSTMFAGLNTLILLLLVGKYMAWLPLPALGGILIIVALRMIDVKLFDLLKNKATILDFFVIVTVVISAVTLDLIKASGVGIAMAILLFLREQMGISVIKRKLFGNQFFSKKIRLAQEKKILETKGSQALILELQGQLFFGTTDQLFSKLESYYDTCKYFILDMRRIQSIDFTAANMLKKILNKIKEAKGWLIFTSIPEVLPTGLNVKKYFANIGLKNSDTLKIFEDTESAMEWVEDEIIKAENLHIYDDTKVLDLGEIELFDGFPQDALAALNSCLIERIFQKNELVFKGGDASDEIYFVRKGLVKIILRIGENKSFHILTIGKGGIFGEMAFVDNVKRSADALCLEDSHLFILSRSKFQEVTAVHPAIAGIFYQRIAFLTVNRLRQSNKELQVFQEN